MFKSVILLIGDMRTHSWLLFNITMNVKKLRLVFMSYNDEAEAITDFPHA